MNNRSCLEVDWKLLCNVRIAQDPGYCRHSRRGLELSIAYVQVCPVAHECLGKAWHVIGQMRVISQMHVIGQMR